MVVVVVVACPPWIVQRDLPMVFEFVDNLLLAWAEAGAPSESQGIYTRTYARVPTHERIHTNTRTYVHTHEHSQHILTPAAWNNM